jgi:type I restriction enzyme S subunit
MPRGDKAAIMKYEVPDFTFEEQEKIAGILEMLDRKIQLNTEINENLAPHLRGAQIAAIAA